jgi:hypothetical protein
MLSSRATQDPKSVDDDGVLVRRVAVINGERYELYDVLTSRGHFDLAERSQTGGKLVWQNEAKLIGPRPTGADKARGIFRNWRRAM